MPIDHVVGNPIGDSVERFIEKPQWTGVDHGERLVPKGYKRHAMGMGLAKQDLVQQMETSIRRFLSHNEGRSLLLPIWPMVDS